MKKRFFDLHKKYATICGISQQGDVVLTEEHLPLDQLPTWWAYDCLAAHAGRVVANPIKTRLIAAHQHR